MSILKGFFLIQCVFFRSSDRILSYRKMTNIGQISSSCSYVNSQETKVSCRYVLFCIIWATFESCRWKHYNPSDTNGYPPSSSVFESLSDVIASCSSSIVKPVAFVAFGGHVATTTSTSDTLQNSSRLVTDKVIEFLADWQFKSARFKSGGRDSFMKSEEGWPLLLILARSRSKGKLSWNEDMGSVTVKKSNLSLFHRSLQKETITALIFLPFEVGPKITTLV